MVQLTITHPDGSTETIPETNGFSRTREIGGMRRARIQVNRADADAVTLNTKQDEIALGTIDDLRLVDVEKGGPTWTLVCYSFEWDANKEAPIGGGNLREDTDDTLITDLVNEVSNWSTGSINSQTNTTLSWVFSHAHRHEALRRIERNVPGELKFQNKGTVDYVASLGSDKTGSVTLSAANGNIESEITITERGRELDGTHIRVIGAHEGEAQVFANLVPNGDSGNYENEVTYSTSRWSDSSDTDWDIWKNKDVTDQATIEEEAAELGNEITDPLVEVTATVVGEDLAVGDEVHVTKTDAGLDRDMRIHRIKTVREGATEKDEILLSTRTTARKRDDELAEDIIRFNKAFQGNAVYLNSAGGRQPVDSDNNYLAKVYYPSEVEFEHRLNVRIMALAFRSYIQKTQKEAHLASDPKRNIEAPSTTTIDGSSWTEVERRDPDNADKEYNFFSHNALSLWSDDGDAPFEVELRLVYYDSFDNELRKYPKSSGFEGLQLDSSASTWDTFTTDQDVEDIGFEIRKVGSGSSDVTHSLYMQALPRHDHLGKPGIREEFSPAFDKEYTGWTTGSTRKILPMNPDLKINGNKVAGGENVVATDPAGDGSQYIGQGTPVEIGKDSGNGFITTAGSYPLQLQPAATGEKSYTTSSQIDLSGHDELTLALRQHEFPNGKPSNPPPPGSYFIIGANKGDDYTTYERRVEISDTVSDENPYEAKTFAMDVSDKSGSYYVRVHTVADTVNNTDYDVDAEVGHILLDPIFGELGETEDSFVVDITGQLNQGQVNDIELTSSQPGHFQLWVEGDVYRQILGNG